MICSLLDTGSRLSDAVLAATSTSRAVYNRAIIKRGE